MQQNTDQEDTVSDLFAFCFWLIAGIDAWLVCFWLYALMIRG